MYPGLAGLGAHTVEFLAAAALGGLVTTEGPSWDHSSPVIGAVAPFLEPFVNF
jgi:hypothetical protein